VGERPEQLRTRTGICRAGLDPDGEITDEEFEAMLAGLQSGKSAKEAALDAAKALLKVQQDLAAYKSQGIDPKVVKVQQELVDKMQLQAHYANELSSISEKTLATTKKIEKAESDLADHRQDMENGFI
jgi:predicted DNA-binding transcriptional regulator YafY